MQQHNPIDLAPHQGGQLSASKNIGFNTVKQSEIYPSSQASFGCIFGFFALVPIISQLVRHLRPSMSANDRQYPTTSNRVIEQHLLSVRALLLRPENRMIVKCSLNGIKFQQLWKILFASRLNLSVSSRIGRNPLQVEVRIDFLFRHLQEARIEPLQSP